VLPLGSCSVRGCLDGLVLRTTLISGCVSKLTSGDFGRISTLSSSFVTSGVALQIVWQYLRRAIFTPNILEIGFQRGCENPVNLSVSENAPEKARRRITDVVNRSEAEIDTPEECPEGKAKPRSNGHGRRRRDRSHALKMTRRRRLDLRPKHFENREIFPIFKTLRSS